MSFKAKIFSKSILNIPNLKVFLPECEFLSSRFGNNKPERVIGWGLRPTTKKARAYAEKYHLPYIALEDGFLRSLGLGVSGAAPLSLVVDDLGIYYDTTRPSKLENLILENQLDENQIKQAQCAMEFIRQYRLSKYNHAKDFKRDSKDHSISSIVLVIDQTFGDMAVRYGQSNEETFKQMFETAVLENPNAEIWVKTHPDVLCGKKRGYLTALAQNNHSKNIRVLAQDINPLSLLQEVDKVYCVTSQMGFEALFLGKPVVTFGVPWYAAWGLTDDRHPNVKKLLQNGRRAQRSLEQLFYAAYFDYCRYVDPRIGKVCDVFTVMDYLHRMKQLNEYLAGKIYCVDVSLWKRAFLRAFFSVPSCQLHFVSSKQLNKFSKGELADSKLLVWGQGKADQLAIAERNNMAVLRMEDGFVRSVGLGSNLVAPLSLVVDDLGIYFNPKQPSRLEWILQNQLFSKQDLTLASQLRTKLINENIGKYNVGERGFCLNSQSKKSILVVGQVEDDASIRLGTLDICSNLELLKKVRLENPTDFILYKPHPDVVSGNRKGHILPELVLQFADSIAEDFDVLECINQVDEVHTMTSLAGFEALLRGKTVHCYGLPFYAGWGLTQDKHSAARRTRLLTLEQLIAGVLIYYPIYVDSDKKQFIDVQQAIEILVQRRLAKKNNGVKRSWLATQWEKLTQLYQVLK